MTCLTYFLFNPTNLKAKDLMCDKQNQEHIQKHNLTPRQFEQILLLHKINVSSVELTAG